MTPIYCDGCRATVSQANPAGPSELTLCADCAALPTITRICEDCGRPFGQPLHPGPDPDIATTCWRCPGSPVLAAMPEDPFPEL
jgi:hypothetical protein